MRFRIPFKRRSGGKEKTMAEANPNPTPALDAKALGDAIAAGFAAQLPAALQQANAPVLEALKGLQQAAPPAPAGAAATTAGAGDKSKPLTLEDITKLLDHRDQQREQTATTRAQRERYQGDKLKDLPPIYRDRLGSDPAKWATEEQAIRDQYKADFQAAGGKVEDVGGDQPGGEKPGAPVDLSKNSATQNITLGLKTAKPATGATASSAAPATTNAAGA
jgi:hypothetical protein